MILRTQPYDNVPEYIPIGTHLVPKEFAKQVITLLTTRPAPMWFIFYLYCALPHIGKSKMFEYLEKAGLAIIITFVFADDRKKINKALKQTDEQLVSNEKTEFQKQPRLLFNIPRDSSILSNPKSLKKHTNYLEDLSDGKGIGDGWPTPPWILGGGNEPWDDRFASAGRFPQYYVDPADLTAQFDESKAAVTEERDEMHMEMAIIAKLASQQKKPQEVIVFQRMFVEGDGEPETLNYIHMLHELAKVHNFFNKYILGPKRHDQVGFLAWVAKNFPEVGKAVGYSGVPHFKDLKRKRE